MTSITESAKTPTTCWTDQLADQIKTEIRAQGWSQAGIAKELGIPPSSLARRLNDARSLHVVELMQIGELLGTSAAELVGRATQANASQQHGHPTERDTGHGPITNEAPGMPQLVADLSDEQVAP